MQEKQPLIIKGSQLPSLADLFSVINHDDYVRRMQRYTGGYDGSKSYLATILTKSIDYQGRHFVVDKLESMNSSGSPLLAEKFVYGGGTYIPLDMVTDAVIKLSKSNEYRFNKKESSVLIEDGVFAFNHASSCLASEDVVIYCGEDYINNNFFSNEERIAEKG